MVDETKKPASVPPKVAAPVNDPKLLELVMEQARDADVIDALIDLSVDVTHIGHYLTHDGARQIASRLRDCKLTIWYKEGS